MLCEPACLQLETPYLVRRKSKALPAEFQEAGDKAHQVDWKRSVLLNVVTQTTYSLTVSACKREHLQSVGGSHPSSKDVVEVSPWIAYPVCMPTAVHVLLMVSCI